MESDLACLGRPQCVPEQAAIERIRAQATLEDWSAAIVPDAGMDDLDDEALRVARNNMVH
jgi:hypothetical protein